MVVYTHQQLIWMDIVVMTDILLRSQAFKLKGRLYTLTVLHVLDTEESHFNPYLKEMIAKAPKLFQNTPIVLDFSGVSHEFDDLKNICNLLRHQGLMPVAIQGLNPSLQTLAPSIGLALLASSSTQDRTLFQDPLEQVEPVVEVIKTKLLTTQVRSGQQVVSKGGDLVITSSVSHGAELLADGHIHVYGTLRGRALAGIAGNKQARIFCQTLDAELISIAGFYRLRDAIEPPPGPCQVYLQDGHIQIDPF